MLPTIDQCSRWLHWLCKGCTILTTVGSGKTSTGNARSTTDCGARARRVTLGGHHYFVGEMLTTPSQDSPGVGECSDLTRVRLLRPVAAPSSEPHMWGLSAGIPPAVAPLSLGVVLVHPPPAEQCTHWNIGRSLPQLNRPPGRRAVVCAATVSMPFQCSICRIQQMMSIGAHWFSLRP